MTKCRACGATCDGDVCDDRCANDLEREREAKEVYEHEAAGELRCEGCGIWAKDTRYCLSCDTEYCPTCRGKVQDTSDDHEHEGAKYGECADCEEKQMERAFDRASENCEYWSGHESTNQREIREVSERSTRHR